MTQLPQPSPASPPEHLNIADYFLDARIREGRGDSIAIMTETDEVTYRELQTLSNQFGHYLREAGIRPEERVILALPDSPEFVAALFGILKIGAVVVMVNPHLRREAIEYFLEYTRATALIVGAEDLETFAGPAQDASALRKSIVVDDEFRATLAGLPTDLENYRTHRDDPAIWLFSGGTSGRPKAAVQPHRSYMNSNECYARQIIGYTDQDLTISVPKLYFGYALGSNLLFPLAAGATAFLFPERCTPDVLSRKIERYRPTILVNVPTSVQQMLGYAEERRSSGAKVPDLSSLRLTTSAGEALPVELYQRWKKTFGVELLDGLGTAEVWHIFISNRPDEVRPGTLGRVVPGFEVRICDEEGTELPPDEVGYLWVRGGSRANGYWQRQEETINAFQGEWYRSEDMLSRDADGYFTYHGRDDDMLKVSGKWLAPAEVENCLLKHPAVDECAVVGITDDAGLTRTRALLVMRDGITASVEEIGKEIQEFVREHLETYKVPREITILDKLPRTHLGKIDRGALREGTT